MIRICEAEINHRNTVGHNVGGILEPNALFPHPMGPIIGKEPNETC
jgi:hypothetical protein